MSSSGVVVKREDGTHDLPTASSSARRRDSYAGYRLQPYQARLDVEMDDTAVSKVRDPSVSLVIDPAAMVRPPRRPAPTRLEAAITIAVGAALGALIVVIVVLIAHWI